MMRLNDALRTPVGIGAKAESLGVDEAKLLSELDVVRPEELDVRSPLEGILFAPSASDDLRLPRSHFKASTAKEMRTAIAHVSTKCAQPMSVDHKTAKKIGRLGNFLKALESIQGDIQQAALKG